MATTEQLMSQYGVAWFGFDEVSGNVYDKLELNNYIGTVTGATRTGGWNGNGNALNFNGVSDKVDTNIIMNILSFTYKMKIKVPVNGGGYAMTVGRQSPTNTNNTIGYGIGISKTNGTIIVPYWVENTSAFNAITGNKDLRDSRWHDIVFTQDERVVKVYVDSKLEGIYTHTSDLKNPINPVRLGYVNVPTYENWYLGQLDDLQIYNKALSPSDFTQKRLVVKTTDNKNLVLSPNSARVKEIPSTVEYMMLAQGGVIREIDSAVDSQPIDFTKPTTEYELVTNNRTPLGKGGMFTIPIGTDFKTAMIEDNY